eukprot:UN30388
MISAIILVPLFLVDVMTIDLGCVFGDLAVHGKNSEFNFGSLAGDVADALETEGNAWSYFFYWYCLVWFLLLPLITVVLKLTLLLFPMGKPQLLRVYVMTDNLYLFDIFLVWVFLVNINYQSILDAVFDKYLYDFCVDLKSQVNIKTCKLLLS